MKNTITTIEKIYSGFPFAHRQHNHDGHCAWIHGHNWTFRLEFSSQTLDANGFVVDFGRLQFIKDFLNDKFDHTLVLNHSDLWLSHLNFSLTDVTPGMDATDLAKIVIVPNCGAEGLAEWLLDKLNNLIVEQQNEDYQERGVQVTAVTVMEDEKNSATVRKVYKLQAE